MNVNKHWLLGLQFLYHDVRRDVRGTSYCEKVVEWDIERYSISIGPI
jgi:hypothetical protein